MKRISNPQIHFVLDLPVGVGDGFSQNGRVLNNLYGYVDQNPVRFVDYFGLYKQLFPGQDEDDVPDDDPDNPDPDFPDDENETICSLMCAETYAEGVEDCSDSCYGPSFYSSRACQQSWSTWLTNCRVSCAVQ